MVQKLPFDISIICQVLGISYGKFYRWLKKSITDFRQQEIHRELHKHDLSLNGKNPEQKTLVPILRPEHIGEFMAIDEKHINGKFHTVFSNAKTGKVALLCSTIQVNELNQCFSKFGSSLSEIKYITRDLSPTFEKTCNVNLPNAIQIADKFHVVRHAIEALQTLRLRLKQDTLKKLKEQQLDYEKQRKVNKNKYFIGPKMNIPRSYQPYKCENGETLPELLSRSRYLCAISEDKWNSYQTARAKLLFHYFPDLKEAYYKILAFRNWYKAKPSEFEPFMNEKILGNWLDEIDNTPINELANFRNLVINHENEIINYHRYGNKTNAIAESINAKINDANRKNKGTRDIDYFNYRLAFII